MNTTSSTRIPRTHRAAWPDTTFAEPLTSSAETHLTAWLRPGKADAIDKGRLHALAATPPAQRTYFTRKELAAATDSLEGDREILAAYCAQSGIAISTRHWRSATIKGPLDRLIAAFGATAALHVDANGHHLRVRTGSLFAPPAVADVLHGVFGLQQWPRSLRLGALQRHATPLTADQAAARYNFPAGDGTGQTIAIVQFRGQFGGDDFTACMTAQNKNAAPPIVKRVDNAALQHERETTKDLEAALDCQIAAALAPGARIVVYEAPDDERGFLDAIRTAIFDEDEKPTILSVSYGWPEFLWTPAAIEILDDLFAAAALLGISVFCSSGDNGAELDYDGKPHVLAPASSPHVFACGATVIADAGEVPWDRSGTGASAYFQAPPWQSTGRRTVPDGAAQQNPGYLVYVEGTELALGGTSAVAPLWAALTARLNQHIGVPAGLFTPLLYAARRAQWTPQTGLGVPDGASLIEALS